MSNDFRVRLDCLWRYPQALSLWQLDLMKVDLFEYLVSLECSFCFYLTLLLAIQPPYLEFMVWLQHLDALLSKI